MAAGLAGAIVLLTACAGPIAVAGPGPSPPAPGGTAFELAATPEGAGPAAAAVEVALIERGFDAESGARHRVDVAFAVAPTDVAIAEIDTGHAGHLTRPGVALCRRQRYVLSVAMIDRRDGRVVFRNRASAARCGQADAELVGALARAVVEGR
jgi:hypothetical protein